MPGAPTSCLHATSWALAHRVVIMVLAEELFQSKGNYRQVTA